MKTMTECNQYARSNRLLYYDHELETNVVTRGTIFDILVGRSVRNHDANAQGYVLRLVKYYQHRDIKNVYP